MSTIDVKNEDQDVRAQIVEMQKSRIQEADTEDLDESLDWDHNDKGGLKSRSIVNVDSILKSDRYLKGLFGFNEFTGTVEILRDEPNLLINKGPLADMDVDSIAIHANRIYKTLFSDDLLNKGILHEAREHPFNPVKDRIEKDKWDGIKRLDTAFSDYLGAANTPYTREVCRRWFVGAVARVYQPGIKFELMPVLVGGQGIGKSTFCGAIIKDYFKDGIPQFNSEDKDTLTVINKNWIVEVAELSSFSKASIEQAKQFISNTDDQFRKAYGRNDTIIKRKCVFIGTSNDSEFLKDKTGNRRFMPIFCSVQEPTKDIFNLDDYDMQQILAEAKVAYDAGEQVYLKKEIKSEAEDEQSKAMVHDEVEDTINLFLNMPVPDDWEDWRTFEKQSYFLRYNGNEGLKRPNGALVTTDIKQDNLTVKDILEIAFQFTPKDARNYNNGLYKKVGLIMSNKVGWEIGRINTQTGRTRGFVRKQSK